MPAPNFQSGGVLEGHQSTTILEPLPNYDSDINSNGLVANASVDDIQSGVLTLEAGTEPTGEATDE